MSNAFNFSNIRTIDASQHNGFEEFCCQLFYFEKTNLNVPENALFYRVRGAGGDGGIEGYWKFPDGKEIGIQAKYFLSLDNPSDKWKQVQSSIEAASISHPSICKFILCFPIDLTDKTANKRLSNRDRLIKLQTEWAQKGIEIIFWGSSELIRLLELKPELEPFWFDTIKIDKDDFLNNFEIFKDQINDRYQPNIHVELNNFEYFDYLQQNNKFKDIITYQFKKLDDLSSKKRCICSHLAKVFSDKIKEKFAILAKSFEDIINNYEKNLLFNPIFESLENYINELLSFLDNNDLPPINLGEHYTEDTFNQDFNDFESYLYALKNFFSDKKFEINKSRCIFLNGEGGKGKTHFLASVVESRNKEGLVSLIFDAGQFDLSNSISANIKKYFGGFTVSDKDFFTALDTLAYLSGQRGVIFIDGLDEKINCKEFKSKIPHFIREIAKYKHLAVAFSYRTEYEQDLIPESIQSKSSLFCTAPGFVNIEILDLAKIFNEYNIEIPTLPSLYPEFFNPLFLILYCKTVKNMGDSTSKSLASGYVEIFINYLDSVNYKISKKLDLCVDEKIIQKVSEDFVIRMHELEEHSITVSEAKKIIKKYHHTEKYSESLFKNMLSDGLIYKYKAYDEDEEFVRFAFGKFSDFIIINTVLEKEYDPTNPLKLFKKNGKLYSIAHNYMRHTFVEIMGTILAEKTNGKYEILDIFEEKRKDNFNPYSEYFRESIKNRNAECITKRTINLLFKHFHNEKEKIIETLLEISLKENCIFDSKYLHTYLKKMKLFERDNFWSVSIDYIYRHISSNIVEKIISYTWLCDENMKNNKWALDYAIILSWFLSSTNRELRDKSTKSLTNLFTYNLGIVPKILKNFTDVNDAYVIERIYCAAYGACLRNKTNKIAFEYISNIASHVYKLIFEEGVPPANFYLRDHAKNIIELALSIAPNILIDHEKILPPYKSGSLKIPSKKIIKEIYNSDEGCRFSDGHPLLKKVFSSVMSYFGDFGNYIIEHKTNRIKVDEKKEYKLGKNARLWILERVAQLCDYKKLPDGFEDYTPHTGRSPKVIERFGKKYQWIALFEFMGLALDKYKYCKSYGPNEYEKYESLIQIDRRDIDPSLTTKKFDDEQVTQNLYKDQISPNSDKDKLENWCKNKIVPIPQTLIEQTHLDDDYLNLCTYYNFYNRNSYIKDEYDGKYVTFYWFLKSYLIKKEDLKRTLSFFTNKNFFGRWMPEESDYADIYVGEYPTSNFFNKHMIDSYNWLEKDDFNQNRPNIQIKKLMANYFDDTSRNCSYDVSAIEFLMPSPPLIKEMGLVYGGKDGLYLNDKEERTVFNPYLLGNGTNSILIKRREFIEFLNKNNYAIFWTIGGEKIVEHGKIDITGLYYLNNDMVEGSLTFGDFETFPTYQ